MGILSEGVKTQNHLRRATTVEMKKKFVIERLLALNVTQSKEGKCIHAMDYDELKYELILASFRHIDSENAENAWY